MSGDFEYGLLGPLTVRRAGAEVRIAPGRQQALLAVLLLRGGRTAVIDELAEALWGDQPPPTARVTIRNYVGRLRQAMGPGGGQVIVTEPGGYRIILGPGDLDASRFEAALAAARAAAAAGRRAEAAGVLRGGLALWRGEPLAGIGSQALLSRDARRLSELRWQAVEALADADLRLGRHREVIAGLRQATAEQPLRERLHALLMTALYRDGQQAAALAAYRAARTTIHRELGAEPGPELQKVHQQILSADPALTAPERVPAAAGSRTLDARHALPPDTAAFTGRQAELGIITTLAGGAGNGGVTAIRAIGGMPGAGKTALAVHAAHQLVDQFPDGQLFVSLHGHTPGREPARPADVLAGLLAAAGTDPGQLPETLDGRTALWRQRMAGQRALLVLDNAASSAQVAPLLPGSAGCLVLVTSRRHLADLPAAAVPVLVGALPPGQAAQMLTRLAPRAADAPPEAVAELTGLAGHLPLAISLLARVLSRHPDWTLDGLAAETGAGLLTLKAGEDSVAAALAVSWQHLDPGARRFLRLLALHPGTSADAHAAAALTRTTVAEAAGLLDDLHGEGLITETAYRRYGMHDLIRCYARYHATPGEAQEALGRLLGYYARAAARAQELLARQGRPAPPTAGPPEIPDLADAGQALAWARAERSGLLACLDHAARAGQDARVIALAAGTAELLRRDGPWAEAAARHRSAAAAARRLGDRAAEAGALCDLGIIGLLAGDFPAAARNLEQALGIFRDLGDRPGQAGALSSLAHVRWLTHDYPAAAGGFGQAVVIFRSLGDRRGEAAALSGLASTRPEAIDRAAAARAVDLFREAGDRFGEGNALTDLGNARRQAGEYPAAASDLAQALAICRDLGDRTGEARALLGLGTVRRMTGDYPAATRDLSQALGIFRDLGSPLGEGNALLGLGSARRLAGEYRAAAGDLDQALAVFRDLGDQRGEAEALNETGALHHAWGAPSRAPSSRSWVILDSGRSASPCRSPSMRPRNSR